MGQLLEKPTVKCGAVKTSGKPSQTNFGAIYVKSHLRSLPELISLLVILPADLIPMPSSPRQEKTCSCKLLAMRRMGQSMLWDSLCWPRFASACEFKRLKLMRPALKNKLLIAQVGYPLPSLNNRHTLCIWKQKQTFCRKIGPPLVCLKKSTIAHPQAYH